MSCVYRTGKGNRQLKASYHVRQEGKGAANGIRRPFPPANVQGNIFDGAIYFMAPTSKLLTGTGKTYAEKSALRKPATIALWSRTDKGNSKNSHLISHFPSCSGVSEGMRERTNGCSAVSEQSEQCEGIEKVSGAS